MPRSVCDPCCNPIELARQPDSYRAAVLQILCAINDNTSTTAEDVQVVTSCLEVTSAGAWGSIGDRITETRFYQTNPLPPTLVGTIYFNEDTQAVVTGVTSGNTQPCPGADIGESCTNPMFTNICDVVTPENLGLYAEDSTAVSGWRGQGVLGVVNVNVTAPINAQDDYSQISTGSYGNVLGTPIYDSASAIQGVSPVRAEDTAFTANNAVMMSGAVNNRSQGTYNSTQGDVTPISVNDYGYQYTSLYYDSVGATGQQPVRLEDTAFAASDAVMVAGGVNNRNLVDFNSTNADVTPIAVLDNGALLNALVYHASIAGENAVRKEDQPFGASEAVVMAGTQFLSAPTQNAGTTGDVSVLVTGSNGGLFVDLDARAQTTTTSPIRREDAVFGDQDGIMMCGGQINNGVTSKAADGDCAVMSLGAYGEVLSQLIHDPNIGSSAGCTIQEDDPVAASHAMVLIASQRQNIPTTDTNADGDAQPFKGTIYGETWTMRGGGSYSRIVTATTTTVKSGVGILHRIIINTAVTNAVITIYDNTAGSGTVIGIITEPAAPLQNHVTLEYGLRFSTGLTIVTSSTEDITVVYS